MAPATPTPTWAAMSMEAEVAKADSSDSGTHRKAPSTSSRRRPYRSPRAPRYSTVAAMPNW